MAADRVDFIDEDDAGCVLLALLEQVADTAGADAYKHFYEIGAGDREKWHAGFACNRSRQQGLARARRTDQQDAFRNAAAQFLELLRFAQEFDDLLQLFLGLFHAGDVLERHLFLLSGMEPGAAFAKTEGLIPAALHLAHHEYPEGQ